MRDKIDIAEAIRLYEIFRNWREVAKRMIRANGTQYCTDAVVRAVRRHDRGIT